MSDAPPSPSADEHASGTSSGPTAAGHEKEVSLLDILVVLARRKTFILGVTLGMALLGGGYSLLVAEKYTAEVKVVRESQSETPSLSNIGSLGALQGLGISLGGAGGGLSVSAFPNVLNSREVRLAVVRDTFLFPGAARPMTYVEYVNRPPGIVSRIFAYTLYLPWTLKDRLVSSRPSSRTESGERTAANVPALPSQEVDRALRSIKGKVSVSINDESGLMSISVTTGDPQLSADLVESFVERLTNRVRQIRTTKIRERLNFIEQRFQEAGQELETAENRLAQFLESNQNPTTATLRFRRDRLQRQVSFKEQLYSEIQSQLTKTRLELQRRQPVLTVVEKAVPPLKRSWPARTLIVLVSLFFGLALGIGIVLLRALVGLRGREEERHKVEEIIRQIVPGFLRRGEGRQSASP